MNAPSRDGGAPGARSRTGKLLLVLASLLFALALLELGLRVAKWGDIVAYVPDPDCSYRLKPSQSVESYGHALRINALGLRGPEAASPKPAELTRVVFVGDSVTYGGGRLREEELFVRLLEARARADGLSVEALSVSAPGWGPQNMRGYVASRGLHEADLVVLVLPQCDLGRPLTTMQMQRFQEEPPSLRVLSVAHKAYDSLVPPPWTRQDPAVMAPLNVQAIQDLLRLAGEVPVVTVLLPGAPGYRDHAVLWPAFEQLSPRRIDLRGRLEDASLFMDELHLTRAGHARVAELLYDDVRSAILARRALR